MEGVYANLVYMYFVDLEKAYHQAPRNILREVLQEYRVRGSLLGAIQSVVRFSAVSRLFLVLVGLRQGCAWSPILFVVFMDRILRRSQGKEGLLLGVLRNSSLLFANYVVLMGSFCL